MNAKKQTAVVVVDFLAIAITAIFLLDSGASWQATMLLLPFGVWNSLIGYAKGYAAGRTGRIDEQGGSAKT